jgi:CelD/BcsL family acetyltransferase involved in cellulose biosynthesis
VQSLQVSEQPVEALSAETLTTFAALAALHPEWQQLWAQDARATPFQSPDWLLPWWKHLGIGSLASIALRRADSRELVGLAPLYVYRDPASGTRHLFPIGIATTDYLDLLAKPGFEAQVAAAVISIVADLAGNWDVFTFPQLPRGAPLLAAAQSATWSDEMVGGEPHPVLRLGAPGALPIPTSMAANLRTCRNRAARAGQVRFEQADARTVGDFLEALARLHAARWTQRGLPGVLADAAVQACHAEAAPLLQSAGLLRLHGLRLDGEWIAVLYCLADAPHRRERRCYYYIGGFDPRFAAIGPGTLLIAHAIAEAMKEGAAAFDFLRGSEPYKYRWGAVDQPMFNLRVAC